MNKRNKFLTKLALGGLGIGLLLFAASRTLEFVQATMPADKQYMGYLFLLATGIGALIWLSVFLNEAEGFKQRAISFAMGLIDLGGEFVLVYADTMRTSSNNGLVKLAEGALQTFILASVGAIALNALAWYLYKLWDPTAERESQARDLVDDVTEATMKQLNTPEAKAEMIANYAPVLRAAVMNEVAMAVSQIAGQYRRIVDSRLLPVDDSLHVPSNGYPLDVDEKVPSFFSDPRGWFQQKFARSSPTQSPIEDRTVGQEVVWLEPDGPEGRRVRIYCLHCLREGKLWRTPEPCSHVLNATPAPIQPLSTGYAKDVESVSIPGAGAGASTVTEPASNQPTGSAEPYAHLYPPNGDRQHPDFVFARMPSDEWQRLNQAWLDYDNSRMTPANVQPSWPPVYHPLTQPRPKPEPAGRRPNMDWYICVDRYDRKTDHLIDEHISGHYFVQGDPRDWLNPMDEARRKLHGHFPDDDQYVYKVSKWEKDWLEEFYAKQGKKIEVHPLPWDVN